MKRTAIIGSGLAFLSCQSPTQVRIVVTTDIPCSAEPTSGIAAGTFASIESRPFTATSSRCEAGGDVGSLVIVPSGANDDEIAIKVVQAQNGARAEDCEAASYKGCIVARRVLRFLPHRSVDIEVPLRAACTGLPCGPSETCVQGRCVASSFATRDCLEEGTCREIDLLPAGPTDAGTPDVTPQVDGATDAPNDGAPQFDGGVPTGRLLASTDFSSCTVTNGNVTCWGMNHQAELGRGFVTDFEAPGATVPAVSGASINGHDALFCALRVAAVPVCWGSSNAIAGFTDAGSTWSPAPVAALAGATELAVGRKHICFRTQSDVRCFGQNAQGQLGRTGPDGTSIVSLPQGTVAQLIGSREATAVLYSDGRIYGWGQSQFEQFGKPADGGDGVFAPTLIPWPLAEQPRVLAAFATHLCAILTDNTVACWGHNDAGKAGGDTPSGAPYPPTRVRDESGNALSQVTAVAVGTSSSCVVANGSVYCWGANASGQLGVPSSERTFSSRALKVNGLPQMESLTLGDSHACARTGAGEVWCWGDNGAAQIGLSPDAGATIPAPRRVF